MARLRLAELRPGVWIRPDNLIREWPREVAERAWRFESRSRFDVPPPRAMVARLWDLERWARTAESLIEALGASHEPAERLVIGAAMVRHLGDDPVLPPSLLPGGWPGPRLRSRYADYRREVGDLMGRQRGRLDELG
jgi:phenylacetic acid degradation operon negative regulatory protein